MADALLIDCDPGIDDMMALLVACASPELDLVGVSTVGGNAGLARTTRNARAVLALAGRADIPVAAGAARPLVRSAASFGAHVHGEDGLGGIDLPVPPGGPDPRSGALFLAETILAATRPVTLVAIGPLTNVALLYAMFPDAAARLARLVVMAGAVGAGNITRAAEFNAWWDPEAAYRVLTDPGVEVATTQVTLDLTLRCTLPAGDVARLRAAGPAGERAAAALDFYSRAYRAQGSGDVTPVHDAIAVLAALRPELFRTRPGRVLVDTGTGPERGATVVDPDPAAAGPRVAVADDGDVPALLAEVARRLAG
ncbi:purine nucleosidase [Catellatospora sp. TT07R-123]|uniref:nucleoside hydrolase n=1 Tax=Catellatospora sp. TT07R-123 TaxID=2733863 RepID=UPI001B0E5D32|nr:nucleoside hydrolase [Catellatospora sp. TT07R-123]GHJ44664.1 purine nucleosidase [Catellatospora sp. TT07R-123]